MALFGEVESEGTPLLDKASDPNFVADARTKAATDENESKSEEEIAEAQRLKDEAEDTGTKTQEQLDEEKRIADEDAIKYEGKTPEEIVEIKKAEEAKVAQEAQIAQIRQEERAKFLSDMGVASEEELKEKLNPKKPLTPEEQKTADNIYNANLAKFAVENKVFDNEEWLGYHNIMKLPNADLVYKEFENAYTEINKERKNDEGVIDPVTADEIKDKFNELYHIDSENAALKAEGQRNIDLKAAAIKGPLETKYNDIKSIYDNEVAEKQTVPAFRTFMQDILGKAIPATMKYGEGDSEVIFDLSKLDKVEFETSLIKSIGDREFTDFMKGRGTPEQRTRIENEITKELLFRHHKEIAQTNYGAGLSAGKKIGAKGSDQRFVEPDKREQKQTGLEISPEDAQKVANDLARV